MPSDLIPPVSSAVLAAATTFHVGVAVIRRARSWPRRFSPWALPGFVLGALPWLFPTPDGLAGLFIAQGLWFLACERAFPPPPPVPAGWEETKVLEIVDQTEDIRTFRMRRPKNFDYKPGQFLTIQIRIEGKPAIRCYSICSAPATQNVIDISVKRQGLVSGALHQTIKSGSALIVRKPAGPFVYPEGTDLPIVLLGGGVGITPLLSMLRHAVVAEPKRRVTLVFSVKTERDIPFREELLSFEPNHPQTKVVFAVTRGGEMPGIHKGRVDADLLRRLTDGDPTRAVYCICGPTPMIDGMKELLAGLGVPREQVLAEEFQAAVAAASAPAGAMVPVTLVLKKTGGSVRIPPGRTLLEAAEAGGAEIPFACRSGVCKSCRTKLVSGEVDCDAPALDDKDRAEGFTYPCVAWARTNCEMDA